MKRVIIVGARRTRQGIGEFVARAFHQAGARVTGVVGSSAATAADAAHKLHQAWGIEAEPFATVAEAVAADRAAGGQAADLIVALCSPFRFHQQQLLELAGSEHRPHVLCEKPMWWPTPQPEQGSLSQFGIGDLEGATAALVDPFLEAGRVFDLVTQWPCTLPSFFQLYSELEGKPVVEFEMLLSPISTSAAAVLDSVPHVLSMLQTLVGCGSVANASARYKDGDRGELHLDFEYNVSPTEGAASPAPVKTRCRFPTCPERPRPAGYGLKGAAGTPEGGDSLCWVDRTIELPAYEMGFRTPEGRSIPLPDPLELLVKRFCQEVDAGIPSVTRRQALLESVSQLMPLVRVVRDLEESE